jgi:hypothetical protein
VGFSWHKLFPFAIAL